MTDRAMAIATKVEAFVRNEVIPYEKDSRLGFHGPEDALVRSCAQGAHGGRSHAAYPARRVASDAAGDSHRPHKDGAVASRSARVQHGRA